jgi:hypothetical protein
MKYWTSTSTVDKSLDDSIVKSVIKKYSERSQRGIDKYGTTMDREDLSVLDWLRHAQEEAMDLSLYLEKLIVKEELAPHSLSTMHTSGSSIDRTAD